MTFQDSVEDPRRNSPLLCLQTGPLLSQCPGDYKAQDPGGKESEAAHLQHMVRGRERKIPNLALRGWFKAKR